MLFGNIKTLDATAELLNILDVTKEDVPRIPAAEVLPHGEESYEYARWAMERRALKAVVEMRLNEDFKIHGGCFVNTWKWEDKDNFAKIFRENCALNRAFIMAQLSDRTSSVTGLIENTYVNGRKVRTHCPGPCAIEAATLDKRCLEDNNSYNAMFHEDVKSYNAIFLFEPNSSDDSPAVNICIRPKTAHDAALLMGIPFAFLDWRFRFWKYYIYGDGRTLGQLLPEEYKRDPLNYIKFPYDHYGLDLLIAMSENEYKNRIGEIEK